MNEWISVETKLPKPNQCVQVYSDSVFWVDPYINQVTAIYRGGYQVYRNEEEQTASLYPIFEIIGTRNMPLNITHWMPLPEPPNNKNE